MSDINAPRTKQSRIAPDKRVHSFNEVNIPFTKEEAKQEANRCLSCINPSCEKGCPLHMPIRDMIKLIKQGEELDANDLINSVSPLSGLCAIVCNHADQCEGHCIRNKNGEAVAIGALHRYVASIDNEIVLLDKKENGKKVAIIGAGPSGLSCAYELNKVGYDVTVYEKEKSYGGVPYYGIPSFRLPNTELRKQYQNALTAGIHFIYNKETYLKDIINDYDAIYIATGVQLPNSREIPGDYLQNVIKSATLLKDIKLENQFLKYSFAKNVYVVGGGNVAIDAARTIKRICPNVTILYRRTLEEITCQKDEFDQAMEEGVKISLLSAPIECHGSIKLESITIQKMELGELDATGRRKPVPIKGSEKIYPCDLLIYAVGQKPEGKYYQEVNNDHGYIQVNEKQQTSIEKVFAGGDVVRGSQTVVHAVYDGKVASKEIDNFLKNK